MKGFIIIFLYPFIMLYVHQPADVSILYSDVMTAYSADKGYKPSSYYEIYKHNQVYLKQNS